MLHTLFANPSQRTGQPRQSRGEVTRAEPMRVEQNALPSLILSKEDQENRSGLCES